jgi:hypothetical protein
MNDYVGEVAAGLDALAVPLGLDRLATLGLDGSGAYAYYEVRLRRGTIFASYELALARALLGWPEAPRIVHEIGGGFGGLSMLLARLGFRAICLEYDVKRFDGAMALLAGMSQIYPDLANNCEMINARFPMEPGALPSDDAMALITNLVCTTTSEAKADIITALRRYPEAIIDIDRFLVQCQSPEERAMRLEEFRTSGFVGELFLDLGKSAYLYRFRGLDSPSSRQMRPD